VKIEKKTDISGSKQRQVNKLFEMLDKKKLRRQNFEDRPKCDGAIRKRSFVSRVKPSVHTGPSRKRSFSNKFFNPGEIKLKTLTLQTQMQNDW